MHCLIADLIPTECEGAVHSYHFEWSDGTRCESESYCTLHAKDMGEAAYPPRWRFVRETWDQGELDSLTRRLTAFDTFLAMVTAPNYTPTLRYDIDPDYDMLADAYDMVQTRRDDPRRAHRWYGHPTT